MLGTPENPETAGVRKFLSEFLNDKRVMDIPWFLRKLLVNFIIVPFRAPKSAKLYQKLWTEKGSPLLFQLLKIVILVAPRAGAWIETLISFGVSSPQLTANFALCG